MGHQAISRWTCDNCKTVSEEEMRYSSIAEEKTYSRLNGWDTINYKLLCPVCVVVRQDAIEAALASRRKETPDAQS